MKNTKEVITTADDIAIAWVSCNNAIYSADANIAKYIAIHGVISTEIIDSIISFYDFLNNLAIINGKQFKPLIKVKEINVNFSEVIDAPLLYIRQPNNADIRTIS